MVLTYHERADENGVGVDHEEEPDHLGRSASVFFLSGIANPRLQYSFHRSDEQKDLGPSSGVQA